MMIVTTRFTRKKAVLGVLLLGLIMALAIVLTPAQTQKISDPPELASNQERVAYLRSLGWEVANEPLETLQFLLPETLEEPYISYNRLQLPQGFDLSSFCGKQVDRFTYAVTNYPKRPDGVQANLYICEKKVIAGDICSPGKDGFQQGLLPPAD